MSPGAVELADIQGLLRRGYGHLYHARFLVLEIVEPESARRWVRELASVITHARADAGGRTINVAFTHPGLARLGLPDALLGAFPRQMKEGMTEAHRRRVLGDFGTSDPDRWAWGGPKNDPVHGVLLLYAETAADLDALVQEQEAALQDGVRVVERLSTRRLPYRKEHFGFRDGIAQPEVRGFWDHRPDQGVLATGEFVLGYENEAGRLPEGPPRFGRNGSYLVFRELVQDVSAFWTFIDRAAATAFPGDDPAAARILLASKMVGRWPSGAALTPYPDGDPFAGRGEERIPGDECLDDFLFLPGDRHGYGCPIGSHIRRSNPRDSLAPSPERSLQNTNFHRIVRRGRAFGPPLAESMDPADLVAAADDGQRRGLHFLCFNTDFASQFEFIQQSWINNPKLESHAYDSADPIMGAHDAEHPRYTHTFTIEDRLVRRRVTGVSRFVDVRGGAYFFMPGMRALESLGSADGNRS